MYIKTTHVCGAKLLNIYAQKLEKPENVTTQLVEGEPLALIKIVGQWAQVLAAHYPENPGWVKKNELIVQSKSVRSWLSEQTQFRGRPAYQIARQLINTPYLWGGMSEKGIDCSGLVHLAYRRLGRLIPRDADDIENFRQSVSIDNLSCGDLITYGGRKNPSSGKAVHVAFWMGHGRILHAFGRDFNKVVLHSEPEDLFFRRRQCLRIT